ncbi:MAG TPA: bifunctional demethylmenaquinone methyltransferase/2-methoxy-6-polyprenyl-1,4-benzoquinol methylase UbiE [Candidatus Marinimicrobia bacterium]|nr:bifunctional demethylmenaquinone methyltransferase/2-methoxy-6-polyprenyl-1,4-benzoquinol methylase UbiE [Candidatus Neomarinimicrobiota bacterium]
MMGDKNKQIIRDMFNDISPRYDFLNHFLSFGMDVFWRKKLVRSMIINRNETILDAACGTGDLSHLFLKKYRNLNPDLTALDISSGMLKLAQGKMIEFQIRIVEGDVENLPFDSQSFNHVMIAFGIRNLENSDKGLHELSRVLKSGGSLNILEFSVPHLFPLNFLFPYYFHRILPIFGKIISGHTSAYTYLPESVNNFPNPEDFVDMIRQAGFTNIRMKSLSGGICSLYQAVKI